MRRPKKVFKPFSKKASQFKIFQNILECRTIFPWNQFDLYQQNRGKAPADMYLFNLNYKSVTITHAFSNVMRRNFSIVYPFIYQQLNYIETRRLNSNPN